ncbi:MAG: hypothetical protein IJK42_15060 [Prevotella sp.]|nr:hypothetical protein [Prevotella sp.]
MKRVFLFMATLWLGIMGASAQTDNCDVNGDGVVNIADVTYVLDHILGKGHAATFTVEAIDLGLPSGTKWASCNVGASSPEEYGGYYAWGETEEKEVYDESTYKYYQNDEYVNLGIDISGTEYDVAHVKWGGNWCMPTLDDINELYANCRSEWTTFKGVNGEKFTSNINGNSIFLPAAGIRINGDIKFAGDYGIYWSSTQHPDYSNYAHRLGFGSGGVELYGVRRFGQTVRPVIRN